MAYIQESALNKAKGMLHSLGHRDQDPNAGKGAKLGMAARSAIQRLRQKPQVPYESTPQFRSDVDYIRGLSPDSPVLSPSLTGQPPGPADTSWNHPDDPEGLQQDADVATIRGKLPYGSQLAAKTAQGMLTNNNLAQNTAFGGTIGMPGFQNMVNQGDVNGQDINRARSLIGMNGSVYVPDEPGHTGNF